LPKRFCDPSHCSMGAGASARYAAECAKATDEELRASFAQLTGEQRQKIASAIDGIQTQAAPVVVAAGENEDGVDTELAIELQKQEYLFLKCLRNRAEREKQKKMEKEKRKAAEKAKKDRAKDAAFEGEVDELLQLFEDGVEPVWTDDHGDTLLSEAAAGGQQEAVEVLLGEGCDPNGLGRYHRTPLWRAAYAGSADVIRILLRSGSDPREPDEQGVKPIDVASNPESRELLACWDTSATERILKQNAAFRQQNAKKAAKEEKEKAKRQTDELGAAIEEADRKAQIARSELAKTRKLLQDYRQQKVSFVETGEAQKLAELEPLLEGAEIKMKMYESTVQEWEWKVSRAKLKMSDFQQAQKEKAEKKAGKAQGFKLEVKCGGFEDLDALLPSLTKDLEMSADFRTQSGLELTKGDALIKEVPFSHLRQSEFNKKMLSEYGREPLPEPEEGEDEKESEPLFPLSLFFSRGFNRTIEIKSVADVLLKDVGGLRAADGRWPLVIDPSGRTSTFLQYTGGVVFTMAELQDMDPVRLKKALLKGLLNAGSVIIDMGNFDFPADVVTEVFSKVEKGLFQKLADRSVLYSYLLPRRFKTLITTDVQKDFCEGAFIDEYIQKFVLGFVTSVRDPDFDFAKQFYTISVRTPDDEDEKAA